MSTKKRLIDAIALELDNWMLIGDEEGCFKKYVSVDDIRLAPTVDTTEVVHGRWDRNGYCTVCDFWTCYGSDYNYCPNCGARMDKGAKN